MAQYEPANPCLDPSRSGYLNSHVLFRMSRQLLQEGKPLPPGMLLNIKDSCSGKEILAGGLALSGPGMLSYWPPICARLMRPGPSEACIVDHATLTVRTGKSHLTCYDAHDARLRPKRLKSRLVPFPSKESKYRVWLIVAVKFDVMRAQLGFFEESISIPDSDKQRPVQDWVRFMNSLIPCAVSVPETKGHQDFMFLELGLADCPENVPGIPPSFEGLPNDVSAWNTPSVNVYRIGDAHVAIRTYLPDGSIPEPCLLGLPRQCAARK